MGERGDGSRGALPVLVRAALGNPWAPAVLLIALIVDANTLPNRESVVGSLLYDEREQWAFAANVATSTAYGYRTEAGSRIYPTWRAAATAGLDPGDYDWAVELWPPSRTRRGFWAPTTLTIERNLNRIRGGVPPEGAAFFAATYGPEITADFQAALAGRYVERRIIWPGVAHNLFALAIAALLALSCWLNAPRLKPLLPSERRRRRGLCPRCGYDLTGLQRCPECGRAAA